jgi:phosphopantothenoylcysteine decarboxylase/phosphopantothenate--cysteine ligase
MSLKNRKVLLGITGGIAAYKSAELCRLLVKAGASVRVAMTHSACEFIRPLTFQALSGNPVATQLLDEEAESGMGHIELAKWADIILVAPASANFIAKLRSGLADDILSTLVLASHAKLVIAPAMNQAMWHNPVTQDNLAKLSSLYGARFQTLEPESGEQACGDVGAGRLMEPAQIINCLESTHERVAEGLSVVLTAGPTREAIDPVRYLTNHSSGKMGFALAEAFRLQGANVTLITGPVSLSCHSEITRIDVESAEQMHKAAVAAIALSCDIFVGAAAVADYAPAQIENSKMKKTGGDLSIELKQNPDIIADVAGRLHTKGVVVGFAAETDDVINYARDKLSRKKLDMIIANDVSNKEIGFNSDTNAVTVITASNQEFLDQREKTILAESLANRIIKIFQDKLA